MVVTGKTNGVSKVSRAWADALTPHLYQSFINFSFFH
jgi:hypothetical protein